MAQSYSGSVPILTNISFNVSIGHQSSSSIPLNCSHRVSQSVTGINPRQRLLMALGVLCELIEIQRLQVKGKEAVFVYTLIKGGVIP